MSIKQFYEVTILDTDLKMDFKYLMIPDKYILHDLKTKNDEYKIEYLGLKNILELPSEMIPEALSILLFSNKKDNSHIETFEEYFLLLPKNMIDSCEYKFAQHLTFSRVIPVSQSPVELSSIVDLVTESSGIAIGAYVGFVVAGATPLLYLTVPAGMILCGTAAAIGKSLEEGMRVRLMNFLIG